MKSVAPYLLLNGTTREAMTAYQKALGGDLQLQSYSDAGMGGKSQPDDRIIHAKLALRDMVIMASDTEVAKPIVQGKGVCLCVECDSPDEHQRLFDELSAGGNVEQKPQDTFWNARFASFTDRFGVGWMLNYTK